MVKADFSEYLATPEIKIEEEKPKRIFVSPKGARWHAWAFTILFGIIVLFLIILLFNMDISVATILLDGKNVGVRLCNQSELFLFSFAILSAAAGSAIHAITSFVTFAGNRELVQSWIWWLYMRVPVGVLLGILVYLGLRAGSLMGFKGDQQITCESVYLIGFVTGIAGLFSKQVTDKLSDIIDSLIAPARSPERKDPLRAKPNAPSGTGQQRQVTMDVPEHSETMLKIQSLLIEHGYLAPRTPDGKPSDNGLYGDQTHQAIERFLAEIGIVEAARATTLGGEADPDFWVNLQALLEDALEARDEQSEKPHPVS